MEPKIGTDTIMKAKKFVSINLVVAEIPDEVEIKVGIMFLWPYVKGYEGGRLPAGTLLCCGQQLTRERYPELSAIMPAGDFYTFQLPDLEGKFLVDFHRDGSPTLASGCIYYETVKR